MMIDGHGAALCWLLLPRVARGFVEEHSFSLVREELGMAGRREAKFEIFTSSSWSLGMPLGKAGIGDAGTEISTPSTFLGKPWWILPLGIRAAEEGNPGLVRQRTTLWHGRDGRAQEPWGAHHPKPQPAILVRYFFPILPTQGTCNKGKRALEIPGDDENVKYLKLFLEMQFSIFSSTTDTKSHWMTRVAGVAGQKKSSFFLQISVRKHSQCHGFDPDG